MTATAPLHSTGVTEDTPWGVPSSGNVADSAGLHSPPVAWRDRTFAALARLKTYFMPPSLLTDPPPSMTQLAAYARRGAWTGSRKGFIRSLGVWWYRLVAIPVTAVCRYVEWTLQRAGRAVAVYLVWRLLISTGGPAVHTPIHTVLRFVAWVLL